jgi:predicted Zn-dependent protease
VSDDVAELTLTIERDGRVAQGTTTATAPDAIREWVAATIATADAQNVDEDWPGLAPPADIPHVDHFDEETAEADPSVRAELVRAFVDAGEGLRAAGMCETVVFEDAFANSAGQHAEGRWTRVVLDGIHQTDTTAGSGHSSGGAISGIDAPAAGREAAVRARDGLHAFDTKPDRYEVVLAPEAVGTIAQFLGFYGFNGRSFNEGMSFVKLGEERFDESVNLYDDATDPRALGVAFDSEGSPRHRVNLIDHGTTANVVHTRKTGRKAGVETTGSSYKAEDGFGTGLPFADRMFVDGGSLGESDLIRQVERGIYVATFNYCRILDPKTLVVTGLTRNGTFMIENGMITGALTNMRFTQSFVDALAPGQIGAWGNNARFNAGEFGNATVHAPSVHLKSWNMTGGADG